ncbi:tyrosine-protein kinase [Hymenobacter sp. YC55]|uniref:GumC family protein n=1 Tax=Hymenobacter sp. YC55 TaxID=3034019 RepID=UPI0023F8AAFA|nr:tyrosine-protein kinase [Hymenobacter sp. YC55]MDF7814278.1 polysaccharide biosynthesis tyrosine autokinase [Hymenobacter sp. YC55]
MSNQELFPLSSERNEAVDLKSAFSKYLRYWYLFLLGAVIAIGIAYTYLRYYAVPEYYTSSLILIKDEKSESGTSSAMAINDPDLFKSSKNVDDEVEVLKSKTLMQRVIRELDLSISYVVEGRIRDVEIYGKGLPIQIITKKMNPKYPNPSFSILLTGNNSYKLIESDGKTNVYQLGEEITRPYGSFTVAPGPAFYTNTKGPNKKINIQFHQLKDMADVFFSRVDIKPSAKNASVITMGIIDPIPERGEDIINKIIEVYEKESVEDKNAKATNTVAFLDERLKYITAELAGAEKNVQQYKSQEGIADVSTQASNYLSQASDYNRQLSEWATQIEVLESIERYMSSSEYKTVPSSLGIQDPTLLGLITSFNDLQLQREVQLRTSTAENPVVVGINEQLANLRRNILENLRNIKKGLVITSNNLKQNSGNFQSKIKRVPLMERELLEINRQQAVKQNLYLFLLQKREEVALALAATVSNTRVIDQAVSTPYPISPNPQNIYLIALLAGLGIPFAGIFIKNMLNDKVQSRLDVEKATATPILGEICHNSRSARNAVVVNKDSRSPIVEMFRLVRANLHFAAIGKENKVMLITSSMGGEGKTFFSINLGASLALTGKKVVLLELDLRKPTLSAKLGLNDNVGITNYLTSDSITINDIIRTSEKAPDLFVISSGPLPPNPAELMMSAKLAHLINELKDIFDHIIIDTAPIGQVSDAFSLSPLVDSTIYLLRYGFTYKKQIEIIDSIYQNKRLNHPMIVLNDAKKENTSSYGYGYGYGYGEEVSTSSKKKSLEAQ